MASYKKIRDLVNFDTITKDHLIPVSTPLAWADKVTGRTSASNLFGAMIDGSSTFELDPNGNLKIKPGAIKAEDISDGAVDSTKLKADGPGSIDIQQIKRKNIIVHVGNYQRNGTKYWASDLYNYSDPIYGERTTEAIIFAGNSNHPDPFFGYYSAGSSDEVIEPFATVCAAARYALHNHGAGTSIVMLVHGHVAWCGTYDKHHQYTLKDVGNWTPFLNVGITAGVHPDHPGNGTEYLHSYADGQGGAARIDVDQQTSTNSSAIPPGMWFRAPTMYVSGINFVFHGQTSNGDIKPVWSGGKGAGGFHELRGLKMQAVGGSHFVPFRMTSDFFFSSGAVMPNEVHTESADMTPFLVEGRDVRGIYSNNSYTNGLYLSSNKTNCGVRLSGVSSGAEFTFKMSQVYTRAGSAAFQTNINSFGQSGGYSYFGCEGSNLSQKHTETGASQFLDGHTHTWVPGNGTTLYQHPDHNTNPRDATSYRDEGYYWNYVEGTVAGTAASPTRGDLRHLLENRMTSYVYLDGPWSNKASLDPALIAGNGSRKSAPTSRTGVGGTSQSSAPYSDQ